MYNIKIENENTLEGGPVNCCSMIFSSPLSASDPTGTSTEAYRSRFRDIKTKK
jgi:hypothetical protein